MVTLMVGIVDPVYQICYRGQEPNHQRKVGEEQGLKQARMMIPDKPSNPNRKDRKQRSWYSLWQGQSPPRVPVDTFIYSRGPRVIQNWGGCNDNIADNNKQRQIPKSHQLRNTKVVTKIQHERFRNSIERNT